MIKVGEVYKTKNFGYLEVVSYKNHRDITVRFKDTGFTTKAAANHIMNGMIKDLLMPYVHGVGFIGDGMHKPTIGGVRSKYYGVWHGTLQRCYSPIYHSKRPTYTDCYVAEEWHNFQNFAEWCIPKYIDGYHLDKDLLVIGNKVYSKDTCVFVPSHINTFLMVGQASLGSLPIGVGLSKTNGLFYARCTDGSGGRVHLGTFKNKEAASSAWLDFKLKRALQLKDEMDKIDERIYHNSVKVIKMYANGSLYNNGGM